MLEASQKWGDSMILTDYFYPHRDLTWELAVQCGVRHGVIRLPESEDFDPASPAHWEGLCRRFHQAVRQGRTLEEVLALCKTKRYPLSRLRRMAIAAYLRLPPPPTEPPYLRLLAADRIGCALLREIKRASALPVITMSFPASTASTAAEPSLA